MPIQNTFLVSALAALRQRRLLLAALSGAMLSLAFPGHPHPLLTWLYHPLWAHLALVPLLIESIKELTARVAELETR